MKKWTLIFLLIVSTSSVFCKRHRHREQVKEVVEDDESDHKDESGIPELESYYSVKHTVGKTTKSSYKHINDDYKPTKRPTSSPKYDDSDENEGEDILRRLKEQQTKFRAPIAKLKKTKYTPPASSNYGNDGSGVDSGSSSTIYGSQKSPSKYIPEKVKFNPTQEPSKFNPSLSKYNIKLTKYSPESSNYEPITTKFTVAHPNSNGVGGGGSNKFKQYDDDDGDYETVETHRPSYKGRKPEIIVGNEASYEGTRHRKPTEFHLVEKKLEPEYIAQPNKKQETYTLDEFNAKFGQFSPSTHFSNYKTSGFQPLYSGSEKPGPFGPSGSPGLGPNKQTGPKYSNIGKIQSHYDRQFPSDFPASDPNDIAKYRSEFSLKNIHISENLSNGKSPLSKSPSTQQYSNNKNPFDFKPNFKLQDVPNLYPSESIGHGAASRGQLQNYLRAEHAIKDEIFKQNLLHNPNPANRGQLQQFYKAKEDEQIEQDTINEQLRHQQIGQLRQQASAQVQRPKGPRPASLQASPSKFYPVRKQPVRVIRPYRSSNGASTLRFSF